MSEGAEPTKTKTLYTPPKKGQKQAALYAVLMSDMPDCAKRVFAVLVWHTNCKTGQCDPAQPLIQSATGFHSMRSVTKGLRVLKRAGLITEVRKSRPHHSAAYQIQWGFAAKLHAQWERKHNQAMEARRRARQAEIKAFKSDRVYTPSEFIPEVKPPPDYPHERAGITRTDVQGTELPNPRTSVGVNPFQPREKNARGEASPSPRSSGASASPENPATPERAERPKEGKQEEVAKVAEALEKFGDAVKARLKEGQALRQALDGSFEVDDPPAASDPVRLVCRNA